MESVPARACPSCSAPAQARQRWCLECGAEIGPKRGGGFGPVAGIAATLVLLVGATSAGGYTLLQDGKQPPPPATTVAQAPPPAATELPPATEEPAPYVPPSDPVPLPSGGGAGIGSGSSGGTSSARTGSGTNGEGSGGAGFQEDEADPGEETEPELALTDIALGAVAVVYAPYAGDDLDLGDASRVVDGTTKTSWKAPVFDDPAIHPQLGVYVDLASRETLRKLIVRTPTEGISFEVYGAVKGPPAEIVDEGWDHLATRDEIDGKVAIKLPDRPFRYVLVWITGLPPDGSRAKLSELSLLSLQPE